MRSKIGDSRRLPFAQAAREAAGSSGAAAGGTAGSDNGFVDEDEAGGTLPPVEDESEVVDSEAELTLVRRGRGEGEQASGTTAPHPHLRADAPQLGRGRRDAPRSAEGRAALRHSALCVERARGGPGCAPGAAGAARSPGAGARCRLGGACQDMPIPPPHPHPTTVGSAAGYARLELPSSLRQQHAPEQGG